MSLNFVDESLDDSIRYGIKDTVPDCVDIRLDARNETLQLADGGILEFPDPIVQFFRDSVFKDMTETESSLV